MDLFLFYKNRSFICLQGLILSLLLFAVLTSNPASIITVTNIMGL